MSKIVNVTPHPIVFRNKDGEDFTVESSYVLNAQPMEEVVSIDGDVEYVRTVFIPTKDGKEIIEKIIKDEPDAIIVGSAIASQAYPEIVSLTPAKGTKRTDRVYNPYKFSV